MCKLELEAMLDKTIVYGALRLTVKSDTTGKTNLRCSFTGRLKIYHVAEGRTNVSHDDFMIIEINDRVAVRRAQAYRNGLRLSVSARKRIVRNPSHATMISAYRFRSLRLHVTLGRLAYMRMSHCVTDRHFLFSFLYRSFMLDSAERSIRWHF